MKRSLTRKLRLPLVCAVSLCIAAFVPQISKGTNAATYPIDGMDVAAQGLDLTIYRHVAQVTWVVSDLDRVVDYWQRLGIREIHRDGMVDYPALTFRGEPDSARVKQATGQFGTTQIKWIQPVHGGKYWTTQLKEHKDGICVLSYSVRSPQELDAQVKYFAGRGVDVLVRNEWKTRSGANHGQMVYLDTAAQGGGTMLGLLYDPDAAIDQPNRTAPQNDYPFESLGHFAWVVEDVRKVDAYYTSLGFAPFSRIDHNISLDRVYRGQPGNFEMWLGWNRTGDAPFEWVQQISGPDIYVEYMKKHGEGFHHLGVNVTDMDAAIQQMTARGAPPSQLAAWNTPKGKGRAVYVDTEPYGGVTLELIYDPK